MNTLNGYSKSTLTNAFALTAGGGHFPLSSFSTNSSDTRGQWTITIPGITELYDGLTVRIRLSTAYYNNGANYNTLNVNNLGDKLVWYRNGSLATSHFSTNCELTLTYRTNAGSYKVTTNTGKLTVNTTYTDGWVAQYAYNTDTYYYLQLYYTRVVAGGVGIHLNSLIMRDSNGTYLSLTTSGGTTANKTKNAAKFDLNYGVLYHGTSAITATNTSINYEYKVHLLTDLRYSTNCETTLITNSMVYIVGSIDVSGYFELSDIWYTLTIDTSNNTKVYIPIGVAYDTYRINFDGTHRPLCVHDGVISEYNFISEKSLSAYKTNNLQGGTLGSLPYQSAANTTTFLAAPTTDGYVLKYNTSTKAPYWASNSNSWRPITDTYIGASTSTSLSLNGANALYRLILLQEEFIIGTQTAQTGAWTGVSIDSSIYDGKRIVYWLPLAGSGNATLNLTLSGGTTTGAINCYYGGTTRLTTHYGAGSVIRLVYRKDVTIGNTIYTGWWADANYVDGNAYTSASCSTSGSTAAKGASCTYYTATANTYLHNVFRYSNSAASAITYNVNSTGAKLIYINGMASSTTNYTLPAGSYISFYDGTNYHFRNDGLLPVLGLGNVASYIYIKGDLTNTNSETPWYIGEDGLAEFFYIQGPEGSWAIQSSGEADFTKIISHFGDFSSGTLKLKTIQAPTTSGGTTYGPGTNGQILKSNGSTAYWASDNNSTYAAGIGLSLSGTTFNINAGNEFPEGSSNLTDGTLILTSYASNSGFDDTNAVGTVYKRNASCIYGYIKGKLDSVYQAKGSYLTSHQTIYNLTLLAGAFSAATFDPNGSATTVSIPTHTSHLTNNSGFITSTTLSNYLQKSGGTMTGPLCWEGNDALPHRTTVNYILTIDPFAEGGTTCWANVSALGYLPLTGGTITGTTGLSFKYNTSDTNIAKITKANTTSNQLSITGSIYMSGWMLIAGTLQALGDKFKVDSGGVYWSSDRRLKDNINSARNLNIDSLIKEFDWKDTGKHSWGFIALELLEVLPEAVNYNEDNDRYSVNYDVAHSAAIASLNAKIKLLELRIKELEDGKASNE